MKKITIIETPQQYFKYMQSLKRMNDVYPYNQEGIIISEFNDKEELLKSFIRISKIQKQFSETFFENAKKDYTKKSSMYPFTDNSHNNLMIRLNDYKRDKKNRLKEKRYYLNFTKNILSMDIKAAFKAIDRNHKGETYRVTRLKMLEAFEAAGRDEMDYIEFVEAVVSQYKNYTQTMYNNHINERDRKSKLDEKARKIKQKNAIKKQERHDNASEIVQKMVTTMQSLTSNQLKKFVFGEKANTNLKIVARESEKDTLDSTCNHNLSLSDLQEISVLDKWLNQQGEEPVTYDVIDYDYIKHMDQEAICDLVAVKNSNSCHNYYGAYSASPEYLLENGVKVLRFHFKDNKFIRFYFIDMNKGLAQSDAYYFSKSGKVAVSGGTFTFGLLAKLAGYSTDNSLRAYVESGGSDSVYINQFDTFVGLPSGTVELFPDDDESSEYYCFYSGDSFNPSSDYYHEVDQLLNNLENRYSIDLDHHRDGTYILNDNVSDWLDESGIRNLILDQMLEELDETISETSR